MADLSQTVHSVAAEESVTTLEWRHLHLHAERVGLATASFNNCQHVLVVASPSNGQGTPMIAAG